MKKKVLSVFLCLCLAVGIMSCLGPSAHASTGGKSRDDAVAWALSKVGTADDYDGAYGAQCVDLIYFYYNYLGQNSRGGHAYYYMNNDLPAGWRRYNSSETTPQPGDIVVYDRYYHIAREYGHIGIVYAADSGKYYYVDYNGYPPPLYGQKREAALHTFSCVIRPDWPTPPVDPTVTFAPWSKDEYTYMGKTDASIGQLITVSNGNCTETGMYLYDANGRQIASAKNDSYSPNEPQIFFKINDECHYILTQGTTYKYKFYAIVNGTTYWSDEGSFKTDGTAPQTTVTILLSANPAAGGTVSGGGTYLKGGTTTLRAVPNEGYRFVKWVYADGSLLSEKAEVPVVARQDRHWIAVFEPDEHFAVNVSSSPSAGGTVTGGGSYTQGTTVTVEAVTNSGYTFKGWTENGDVVSTDSAYSFIARVNRNLVAVFEKVFVDLTVKTLPQCSPIKQGQALSDSVFTGGTVTNPEGTIVPGNWYWALPGTVPTKSGYQTARFVPSDAQKYAIVSASVYLQVNTPSSTGNFTDVPADAFYAGPVAWALEQGITSGTSATTFSPNAPCTRAQAVTFLWNAAGKPEPQRMYSSFTDINPSAWYYKAVQWAVENNITTGIGGNRFGPNQTCTRGQIVTFLWRAKGQPLAENSGNFEDVSKGTYYEDAVNWAVKNGITSGVGGGRFDPQGTCKRGHIVTFLYRANVLPNA